MPSQPADTTKRPCQCPQAQHKHGTRVAYIRDRCRCADCREAARIYERDRNRKHLYGRWDHRTDAESVRAHLRFLMDNGLSFKRTAELANVPLTTVSQVLYGRNDRRQGRLPKTVATDVARRLLAIQPDPWLKPDRARMPATGTRRRIQALACMGWSLSKQGHLIGMQPSNFCALLDRDEVIVATAKAVRDLYEQLWATPAPATDHRERISVARTVRLAADRGWLPPLAWDDETIDAPDLAAATADDQERCADDVIDEIAVERAMHGEVIHISKAELAEAIRRLTAMGYSADMTAQRLHVTSRLVQRYRAKDRAA